MTTDSNRKHGEGPRELLLASASPRRRELLQSLGIPFSVWAPDIDETVRAGEQPASYALRLAHEKAAVAMRQFTPTPLRVLAADTVVTLDGIILGKPQDHAEAARMLALLSGKTHAVITAVCLWCQELDRTIITGQAVTTSVTFRTLSADEIDTYVASGEPMDKAGAYAIQGGAAGMVTGINGSWTNVVGLPMEVVTTLLGLSARSFPPKYPAAQSADLTG